MPTRTIKLKLQIPKTEEGRKIRAALWTTHSEVNKAVAEIERLLLLCRGDSYYTVNSEAKEVKIEASEVKEKALKKAREVQKQNGKENAGSDEEVLKLLRSFYEKLVPSVNKSGDGDAQKSNAWVSPMMDKNSEGGLSVFQKIIEPLPDWVEMMEKNTSGWEKESETWLESEDAKRLMNVTGRKPGWITKYIKSESWQNAFIEDQKKKRKEIESGNAPVINRLKELGLFPLMKPPVNSQCNGKGVSPWDRAAVRLAVAHLLSWETSNHKTRRNHIDCKDKKNKLFQEYASIGEQMKILREYETARHERQKKIAFADDDNPFKIGLRMIRSWPRLREEWQKNGTTFEERKNIAAALQTKLKGRFGDPDLFSWLAQDGLEYLWKDRDILTPPCETQYC